MDEEPEYRRMTREEFDLHTFQKFKEPEAKRKAEASHEMRKFWVFAVPGGLIAALLITVATNMGTAGFWFSWLACTTVIYALVNKS